MYEYVKGVLAEKNLTHAVIDVVGIGYLVQVPLSTFELLPDQGAIVKLLTHHVVREDSHALIGFFTSGERDLFRELINISGIGPKVALNILSKIKVADFISAIATSDVSRLKSMPGVGAKTAERLIVELKGKLKSVDGFSAGARSAGHSAGNGPVVRTCRQEAYEAMTTLGYLDKQVVKALDRVVDAIEPDAPIEVWIRKALQVI